ncbi:MAG: hypothetical protein HZA50_10545 [Planctomycetes bacterium]|nr:hypothetical protein [Planctomycetota bacterium]
MGRHFGELAALMVFGSCCIWSFAQDSAPTVSSRPSTSQAATQMVDNPRYLAWAKFKVGTTVKTSNITVENKTNTTENANITIKENNENKIILEENTAVSSGKTYFEARMVFDILRKIPREQLSEDGSSVKVIAAGKEDIKIGKTTFNCDWEERQITEKKDNREVILTVKTWTCKDVPGGLAKKKVVKRSEDNVMLSEYWVLDEFKMPD